MKKFLIILFILIILGAIAFFFGWISFRLDENHIGLIHTKTGDWDETIIESGDFHWRVEGLLPTNLSLHQFSLEPQELSFEYDTSLPSGELYSSLIESNPSFNSNISLIIQYRINTESIPVLAKEHGLRGEGLEEWYSTYETRLKQKGIQSVESFVTNLTSDSFDSLYVDMEEKISTDLKRSFPHLEITSVILEHIDIPDAELYRNLRALFFAGLEEREAEIRSLARISTRERNTSEQRNELLSGLGKVLGEHPDLFPYLQLIAEQGTDPLNLRELLLEIESAREIEGLF